MMDKELEWKDALKNDIEIGGFYVYNYNQNGVYYPIKCVVMDKLSVKNYGELISKVQVLRTDCSYYNKYQPSEVKQVTLKNLCLLVRVYEEDFDNDDAFQKLLLDQRYQDFKGNL